MQYFGKDRSITTVCELLNKPRGKKEAKSYYRIESEDVDYKAESEGDVSEIEIQNILSHYKKLGKNEEKYVESFEHIATQYTDSQLRLIVKFLPLNVKAVLEANSLAYQQIISFGTATPKQRKPEPKYNDYPKNTKPVKQTKNEQPKIENENENVSLDIIEKNLANNKITEPVIIPSGVNTSNVRKIEKPAEEQPKPIIEEEVVVPQVEEKEEKAVEPIIEGFEDLDTIQNENNTAEELLESKEKAEVIPAVQPKRRGRPKKVLTEEEKAELENKPKRGRGRPKKVQQEPETQVTQNTIQQEDTTPIGTPINLFDLGEEDAQISEAANNNTSTYSDMVLPGLDDEEIYMQEEQNEVAPILPQQEETMEQEQEMQVPEVQAPIRPNLAGNEDIRTNTISTTSEQTPKMVIPNYGTATPQSLQNVGKYQLSDTDLSSLITKDKKIVAFVGTSKNGTSFLVNNLAEMFSQKGIKTALLDLTQNRNAYYIYTQNEENLRETAYKAIENLRRGEPKGLQVNKNLTVYTTLPGENQEVNDYSNILETLLRNYSLILLDCDFETNYGYFKEAQEIFLVQSLDVLTIQPLTAFLRDLKAKNVLNPEKIRIALNKIVRVRSISEKTIIGGMAYYNDPAMSFMTELFNKDVVPYCSIPFEEQAYSRYLEGLINCKISLNGYSKNFMTALSKLGSMVYPLISNTNFSSPKGYNNYASNNSGFSSNMNNTLNKMKNNY